MTKRSMLQTTIADTITLNGIGVHSGKPVSVTLHPSDEDTGITFQRSDADREVPANWKEVTSTSLCTVLDDPAKSGVATVEHLMAALRGLNIDNVLVETEGHELPILDGSSAPFVDAIDQVGLRRQSEQRRFIRVMKPVRIESKDGFSELRPYEGTRFDITIDFDTPLIGRQNFTSDITPDVFRNQLARARTFGYVRDVEKLWAMGYQLGSSLENSVAISDDAVLNPEGTRWPDEFVRHKALDAVGDLALAGLPILGMYRSFKAGHRMNHEILQALFSDDCAYEIVDAPTRRDSGHAEIGAGIAVAALSPNVS